MLFRSFEKDAINVVEGYKKEISASKFGQAKQDNKLYRWLNPDESISIEIDYKNTARGLFVVTIFANE